jgi:hypothetical protein
MFRTLASLTTLAVAVAVAAATALVVAAVPADSAVAGRPADPVPIGHKQFFAGLVFGLAEQSQIEVACAGPATTGHPLAGQSVEAILLAPPGPKSAGFTGTAAKSIKVVLSWTAKMKTVVVPIGTFSGYYELVPIPDKITVPCGGTGTMSYVPAPGSKSAKAALVSVTFQTQGV